MKTSFLNIFLLLLLFPICTYSQFSVKRILTPRTTGKSIVTKEIYAVINNPQDGNKFNGLIDLNGIARNLPAKSHLWLVVSPRESNDCLPQFKEIKPNESTGAWSGKVAIRGDDGKLIDIVLVSADPAANNTFNDYIINQEKNDFPSIVMPEGAKSLAHITVVKASENITTSDKVNMNYGFSKTGVFYVHKSLIAHVNGDAPYLVAGVTNWTNNTKMILDGEYYIYEAKIDRPYDIMLEYCFYIGKGIYIPQILLEKSSNFILKGDYKSNTTKDGANFYTSPQDYYPGTNNY